MKGKEVNPRISRAFLALEAIFYVVIVALAFQDVIAAPLRYAAICVCLVMAVCQAAVRRDVQSTELACALFFTACADFCFVILDAHYEVAVLLFFVVQIFHFSRIWYFRGRAWPVSAAVRVVLCAVLMLLLKRAGVTTLLLYLAVPYVLNLAGNVFDAAFLPKRGRACLLLFLGLCLFLLCDVTVGFNIMRGTLPMPKDVVDLMARLTWVFYLPSQTLLVLSGGMPNAER